MPIGPKNINNGVRHDLIQRTCYEIDAALQDPIKSRKSVTGDADDYFYSFIFPGLVNPEEKEELVGLYMLVGWELVVIVNSGEANQRPGQFLVKLYAKADSRFLRN